MNDKNINELPTIELTSRMKNLSGQKKGQLTFLKPAERKNNKIYQQVECECGNIEKIRSDADKTACVSCSNKQKSEKMIGTRVLDLTNKKFGRLTALFLLDERKNGNVYQHCKCDCGNEIDVASNNLNSGNTKSCGCLKVDVAKKMGANNLKDLTGQIFNYLTVIEKGKNITNSHNQKQLCRCICGKNIEVAGSDLIQQKTKSCGCKKGELISQTKIIPMLNKKFGKLTVISEVEEKDADGSLKYLCRCDCGNTKIISGTNLRSGTTKSCGCITTSIGEENILNILIQNNINFIKEYKITELNNKRYDFAILDNNKIIRFIEFDGRQHYKKYSNDKQEKSCPLPIRQKRDQEKNQQAKEHNIPLVRIPYQERDNITLEMLMGDKYLVKAGDE